VEDLVMLGALAELIAQMELRPGASVALVQDVQSRLGFRLPRDYVEFITESNGAEGFVGNSYLVLWPIEEIIPTNDAYQVRVFAPGLLLFGSDGGGEAYAFDTRSGKMPVVSVPFVGMSLAAAKKLSRTFSGFLECLHEHP
jgi:hypothetical protein